jgi:hypothetical protein
LPQEAERQAHLPTADAANKKGAASGDCATMKKPLNNPIIETVVAAFRFKGNRKKPAQQKQERKRGAALK